MRLDEPFETERIYFRLLRDEDLNVVHRQFSDPDMCRYMSEPPVTRDQAQGIIDFFGEPAGKSYHRYGLFTRETGEFIGTCGFHKLDMEERQVEIGYDIWKEHWRKGYASEALAPLIRVCFRHLGVDQVYVLINEENDASLATAARAGFRRCAPCRALDEPTQVCMKLTRTEWERGEGHQSP